MLLKVITYLKERENPLYSEILEDRHIKILESLSAVEEGQ